MESNWSYDSLTDSMNAAVFHLDASLKQGSANLRAIWRTHDLHAAW